LVFIKPDNQMKTDDLEEQKNNDHPVSSDEYDQILHTTDFPTTLNALSIY
jgi:hypothetical protein